MINEIIVFVLQGSLVRQIIAIIIVVVGFIGAVIKILRYFQDAVLPFIRSKKGLKRNISIQKM